MSRKIGFFVLVLAIIFAMVFGACGGGSSGPVPSVFNSKDAEGNIYKLTIYKTAARSLGITAGDEYRLEYTPSGGATRISNGHVGNVDGNIFSLQPSYSGSVSFNIIISDSGTMTSISGTVTFSGGVTEIKIGVTLAPVDNNNSRIYTVGYSSNYLTGYEFRLALVNSIVTSFPGTFGFDLILKDAYNNSAQQSLDIQSLIDQRVDYIIITADDDNGLTSVLQNARTANIPVIFADRKPNISEDLYLTHVLQDLRGDGINAVAWMENHFGTGAANIIHIQGEMGSTAQIVRTEPLNQAISRRDNWTLVRRGTGGAAWDDNIAKGIVEAAIIANENFNAIYSENDGMAIGAVDALKAAGRNLNDYTIICFDATRGGLQGIMNREINVSIETTPFIGPAILEAVREHIAGRNPPKQIPVTGNIYTINNVTQEFVNARPY